MNYRHAFHAGNVADVLKHVMLTRILLYLLRKPTALRVIDTHAGAGRYDLAAEAAARTGEWTAGIGRLRAAADADTSAPAAAAALELLRPYLDIVQSAWPFYLGSPGIAAALLRRQDRLVCCELHEPTAATLAATLGRRAKIIALDGYTALNAFVPPPERRGLVLVDPPFEAADEFARLTRALAAAWRKWPRGTYVAWYPLKDPDAGAGFGAALAAAGLAPALRLELAVARPHPERRLAGSGLVVVNPPFGLAEEAGTILPYLATRLATGAGAFGTVAALSAP